MDGPDVTAPVRPRCDRCNAPIPPPGPLTRITFRQLHNPVTVLRLVCSSCVASFDTWWNGAAAETQQRLGV